VRSPKKPTKADPTGLLPVDPVELQTLTAEDIAQRQERFSALYAEAMRPATVRAVRGDWATFATWCAGAGVAPLGIDQEHLIAFLKNGVARGCRRATLDRYLFTIKLAHRAARLPEPTSHPEWRLRWKAVINELVEDGRNRRRPMKPLRQSAIEAMLAMMGTGLRDLRDAALLCLASDTMARREELARVRLDEITVNAGGSATLFIPRSKSDKEGRGMYRPISPASWAYLKRWLSAAKIQRGAVFRAIRIRLVKKKGKTTERLAIVGPRAIAPQQVARIFKRWAEAADLDQAYGIGGHSTRIGSTHDLVSRGYSTAQIANAGGWASDTMVAYYARELAADDSAMAMDRRKHPLPSPTDVVADETVVNDDPVPAGRQR